MNKLTKLLSIFLIAGAISVGTVAAVGCNKGNTGDGGNGDNTQQGDTNNGDDNKDDNNGDTNNGDDNKDDNNGDDKKDEDDKKDDDKKDEDEGLLVIDKDVTGIIVEGISDVSKALSSEEPSYDIDKDAIEVYLAKGEVKGDKVDADHLSLVLRDPTDTKITTWTGLKAHGTYSVSISVTDIKPGEGASENIGNALKATKTIALDNHVVADSLCVIDGDDVKYEQVQGEDEISGTWKYQVTRLNGEKETVTGVEVTGLNTSIVTDGDAEAKLSYTFTDTDGQEYTITGKVTYKINEDTTKVSQSFALNPNELTDEQKTKLKTEDVRVQDGRFVIQATSGSVDDHAGTAPEYEGKYLASRIKLGGKFDGDNAKRYIKIKIDGPATITAYSFENGSGARYVSLYKNIDFSAKKPVASGIVGARQAAKEKENATHVFKVTEAGEYYLVAEEGDVCITYVQVDQLVSSENNSAIVLQGETKLAKLFAETKTKDYKQTFTLNDVFSVNQLEYTFRAVYHNSATAEKVEEKALTEGLTYWLGETQLTPGTTQLTELGEQTITVKVANETAVATYKIVVESAVSGITGITASIKSSVDTSLASDSATVEITKNSFDITLVGENTNATSEVTSVKYRLKSAEAGNEEDLGDGKQLGKGDYVFIVKATVTDSVESKSAEFEATCELSLIVAGSLQDVKYTVTAEDVSTNVGTSATTKTTTLYDTAHGKIVVGTNCKGGTNKVTVNNVEYSSRIQVGGTWKLSEGAEKNAIIITVKEACTVKVIYATSSSGTARTLNIYNAEGGTVAEGKAVDAAEMVEYTVSAGGTYYLGSAGSGINIFYIEFDYNSNN